MLKIVLDFLSYGWVSSLLGLIGLFLTLVLYKRATIGPQISSQFFSFQVRSVPGDMSGNDLTLVFKGKNVVRATTVKMILWNSGMEMIDGSNVIKDDPLRVAFEADGEILTYQILKHTKESNKVRLIKSPVNSNELLIKFDYLDPGDGVSMEIIHSSIKEQPKILGTIKGISRGVVNLGKIVLQKNAVFDLESSRSAFFFRLFYIPFSICLIILGAWHPSFFTAGIQDKHKTLFCIYAVFMGAFILWLQFIDWKITKQKYPTILN